MRGAWGVLDDHCTHGMSLVRGPWEVVWTRGARLAGTQGSSRSMDESGSMVGKHRAGGGD